MPRGLMYVTTQPVLCYWLLNIYVGSAAEQVAEPLGWAPRKQNGSRSLRFAGSCYLPSFTCWGGGRAPGEASLQPPATRRQRGTSDCFSCGGESSRGMSRPLRYR